MLKVVHEENEPYQHAPCAVGGSLLDELARDGARQILAAALQAEVAERPGTSASNERVA